MAVGTRYSRQAKPALTAMALAVGCIIAAVGPSGAATVAGKCEVAGVTVVYERPSELRAACRALEDVVGYFRRLGFDLEPHVTLRFADRTGDHPSSQASTHGYFGPGQALIVAYRTSDVNPWGLPWTQRLAASFLRHELAHMAIWEVLEREAVRLRREWHEFIAYAIQFDLLEQDLRGDILAGYADVRPVSALMEVNEFTYGMNPEVFAVTAYKSYTARGAADFLRQVLRGEIVPPELSLPFPVLPGQATPQQ